MFEAKFSMSFCSMLCMLWECDRTMRAWWNALRSLFFLGKLLFAKSFQMIHPTTWFSSLPLLSLPIFLLHSPVQNAFSPLSPYHFTIFAIHILHFTFAFTDRFHFILCSLVFVCVCVLLLLLQGFRLRSTFGMQAHAIALSLSCSLTSKIDLLWVSVFE